VLSSPRWRLSFFTRLRASATAGMPASKLCLLYTTAVDVKPPAALPLRSAPLPPSGGLSRYASAVRQVHKLNSQKA
jgi:hypothetical protein